MSKEKKLRASIRKALEENTTIQEGFFSRTLDHIEGILQKQNNKRFHKAMAAAAGSDPVAKKVVQNYYERAQEMADIAAEAEALVAKNLAGKL